jgi:hypothetical protein
MKSYFNIESPLNSSSAHYESYDITPLSFLSHITNFAKNIFFRNQPFFLAKMIISNLFIFFKFFIASLLFAFFACWILVYGLSCLGKELCSESGH